MRASWEPWWTVEVDSKTILRGDVGNAVIDELKENLIFPNPIYEERQRRGYWVGDTPRYLNFLEENDENWIMPRGFTKKLIRILMRHGAYFVVDENFLRSFKNTEFTFQGRLKKAQVDACNAILNTHFAVVQLPTGAGKTVVALVLIAGRKQPALVVVHTKELLYQWRDAAKKFLGLKDREIGLLGDGKKQTGRKLTIAIINTLRKMVPEIKKQTGFLVVDECHKTPSTTFSDTVSQFDCQYMLGITATPNRRDGLSELIYLHLGPLVYSKGAREAQDQGLIMQPIIITRNTNFDYQYDDNYQQMIAALIQDQERNGMIASDIVSAIGKGTTPALVVSDRTAHCTELARLLRDMSNLRVEVLTGSVAAGKRKKIVEDVNAGRVDVLVATTSLIGEGFDCKALSALFLATPIGSSTKLEQVVGRVLRNAAEKEAPVVYDYIDRHGIFQASYRKRFDVYQRMNAEFF